MTPTHAATGLAKMARHARNALSDKAHASNMRLERLCMALGAAQDRLSLRRRLTRADQKTLGKALAEWENEGGR
jgi:hypothetical protein